MAPILVTGATGNVGAALIPFLLGAGATVRAAVRAPAKEAERVPANVELVPFDFVVPDTFGPALDGVEQVFLMRPPALSNIRRDMLPFLTALKDHGVRQVVFLSLLGAEKNKVVPHARVEEALAKLELPTTLLRPSFFMQNLDTTHRLDIKDHNEIYVPAGNGRTSFIDVRDIAAVAARTLTEDGHVGQAYPLTGSVALTYGEVAEIFTRVLARPITYPNPALPAFTARMRSYGHAFDFIMVMIGIYTTARLGLAAFVSDDCERLLGRAPITVEQYVKDYRAVWQGSITLPRRKIGDRRKRTVATAPIRSPPRASFTRPQHNR
ncbi:SDR family oxidoreductase [Candidatus Gracilibacteria bacterium]|nr:SDR family oxidoreductase [Candidatus Gracilibacteria bacterium]